MRQFCLSLFLLILLLSGCAAAAGDPQRGLQLFNGEIRAANGDMPACNTCHYVEAGAGVLLGPNLSNIANRAASRVAGQPAAEYLRESITHPDAYLADGFQEGIMWRGYAAALSQGQIADLVAYMQTLQSGVDE